MENGLDPSRREHYLNVVIPELEELLSKDGVDYKDKVEAFSLYSEVLKIVAREDFVSFNKFLELDEDHTNPNKAFYHQRKNHMGVIFDSLNDMEIHDKYDMVLISTPPRTGKEQPLTSGILTPNGWKTMGDMRLGEKVIGHDGLPTTVTGVFPQGEKEIYKVTFDDGTVVECGLDHLWKVQTRDDRKSGKSRVVPLKDIMKKLYVENGTRKNYSIDYVKPIEFSGVLDETDIDPYFLGVLIGDGCLKDSVKFTTIDKEILDECVRLLPTGDVLNRISETISYGVSRRERLHDENGYLIGNHTLSKIRELGLNKNSSDKFIPDKYKYLSSIDRLNLLQGLMDSDGYVGDKGSYCEFTTVSKQLSDDFMELVRSLGGRATLKTKIGSYRKNGVKVECKKVYRISFNMELNPFRLSRKADKFTPRKFRNVKYIRSVEFDRVEEAQCIEVDSPEHLYVTDGYNLTHNTTTGIRFLAWICGRHPENTELATSYSDGVTTSFYIGMMEVMGGDRYREVFSDAPIVNQNAKREEIWLKVMRRYPTISFVPVGGSMTGRAEAGKYLYCDDLVSGIEEALSKKRLDKLWELYTVNLKQRKKDGCKEVHIATQWSVHDPINKLARENADNPRCKIIKLPCYDDFGESNFNFKGGFSTKYYNDLEKTMNPTSFKALYMCESVEREGLLYHSDELNYYMRLPKERPDTIISIADTKNLGRDNVASPVAYVYGDTAYIEDVVYNPGLPEVTRPLVANLWAKHGVVRADVEMNNGGNYYAEDLQDLLDKKGAGTSVRMFFSSNNKTTKIITYADFAKKHFVFKDKSQYHPQSEYAKFMKDLLAWTQTGNNDHDDAPDSIAMLAQLLQDLDANVIKTLDRRSLRL